MLEAVLRACEELSRQRRAALEEAMVETRGELERLLDQDDAQRHRHDEARLANSLGPFAAASMNLGSLSRVLHQGRGAGAMAPEKAERVGELLSTLNELAGAGPITAAPMELQAGVPTILERAEAHFDRLARLLRTLRVGLREAHARDDGGAWGSSTSWRDLSLEERAACPPFVVVAREVPRPSTLLPLLEGGLPLTVVVLRSTIDGAGDDAPELVLEGVPWAMRGLHFVQTCAVVDGFEAQVAAALEAPHPGLLSLLEPRPEEAEESFRRRAEDAVRSRAFPIILLDPETEVPDLSANPAPDAPWVVDRLGDDGAARDEAFTYAHYALSDPALATGIEAGSGERLSIDAYLARPSRARRRAVATVAVRADDGTVERRAVSRPVAERCVERRRLWQRLRGGPDDAIQAAPEATAAELAQMREELASATEREEAAVATAIHRLVAALLS
jgi:hypothetical protein